MEREIMNVAKPLELCSVEEFYQLEKQDGWNYELIDNIVLMSPSPSREHQEISSNLHFALRSRLHDTACRSLYEMDIQFHNNIFKPDMMVFCDKDAVLPEIIFEILSPSTRQRDLRLKVVKYEEMGVKEYWIIDPKVKVVIVHDFVNNTAETYGINDIAHSMAHPEIIIPLVELFEGIEG